MQPRRLTGFIDPRKVADMKFRCHVCLAVLLLSVALRAQESTNQYLQFIRGQATSLRQGDQPPLNQNDWHNRRTQLREDLLRAWGGFPKNPVSLDARKVGEIQREGYRVEKIIFQTLPGVWMTANAYVPDKPGKLPALLMVHGHWQGAKQDPVVQSRCIGAAKLGFFVLVVDAFGAGERGVGKALGEYHGDMTAATLFPVGIPLSGIQVYENTRAADYLQQRPEVDPERIGISGASGGGNQSMYAGAWEERFAAIVPVCSVGNYQAYLGAACCMCEVVPGALKFTEEWAVLGSVAPRALMVINATRDARQFSVDEAKTSLALTKKVFEVLEKPDHLRHTIFESGHDYSKPMREAVYGWMALHLKQQGDGSPIPEPQISTEQPETLRCFPGDSRPDDWMTIPKFAATEGRRLLAQAKLPDSRETWLAEKERLREVLANELLGGFPQVGPLNLKVSPGEGKTRAITFSPEQGLALTAKQRLGENRDRLLIVIDLEGGKKAEASAPIKEADEKGWSRVTLDLRATGELAWPSDKVRRAPDHTSAQWGLWIGRPLLGQWVWDVRRLLDAIAEADGKLPREISLIGIGPAGVVALAAAAMDDRITNIQTDHSLVSYISDTPYENQRMGIIVPFILKHLGDVPHLAALAAPRPLIIRNGVRGDGNPADPDTLKEIFQPTSAVYRLLSSEDKLRLMSGDGGQPFLP